MEKPRDPSPAALSPTAGSPTAGPPAVPAPAEPASAESLPPGGADLYSSRRLRGGPAEPAPGVVQKVLAVLGGLVLRGGRPARRRECAWRGITGVNFGIGVACVGYSPQKPPQCANPPQ